MRNPGLALGPKESVTVVERARIEEPVQPAYDGACITRVISALTGDRQQAWLPEPVRDARAVVLLVIDGLGWNELLRRASLMPVLGSFSGGPITTVVPSTTSAALTSITTGSAPGAHGMTGYRMSVGDSVLNTLRWTVPGGGSPPDPVEIQPEAPFAGRSVPVVTRAEFFGTAFTTAHLRGARFIGWRTTSALVQHCRALVVSGERFVYSYYDGIDTVAHAHGIDGPFFDAECAFTDRMAGDLLAALPADTALVVMADHGQVALEPQRWLTLDPFADLIDRHAGDARCRFLHAVPGAAGELGAAMAGRFGDVAWVFPRERFLAEGWLGPRIRDAVRSRVGDVVLCAREPVAFVDPANTYELTLRSGHGSLTAEEMLVPLLAASAGGG